jgi:hypothetical protein
MQILLLLMLLAAPALCTDQKKSVSKPAEANEETVMTPFGPVKRQTPQAKPEGRPTDPGDGETVQTPFGRVKKQAPPTPNEPRRAASSMVDVEVSEGVATFKRQTPFGVQSWKRPISELSAAEKKMLDDSLESGGSPSAKPETAPQEKIVLEPR